MIVFKGWQKTSLMEYPDKIATVLFTGGCNFRCPYCYNSGLVLNPEKNKSITEYEVMDFLTSSSKFYQAVIVSGGEPCMQPGLADFLAKVKELGLLTGLETNGSYPDVVNKLLNRKLLNYIAMDIKAPLDIEKYSTAAGIKGDMEYKRSILERIKKSIEIISSSGIKYEFRTTFAPEISVPQDADSIAELIKGNYAIQCFIPKETVLNKAFTKIDSGFKNGLKSAYLKAKNTYSNMSLRNI